MFDYGVAGITYNKKTVKNPPKSFKEFVDRTAAGEWAASLPSINYAVTPIMLIWAWLRRSAAASTMSTPSSMPTKKMRKNLIFWGGPNDFFNHLSSGEADIGIYFDGRTWAHVDAGADWIDLSIPPKAVPSMRSRYRSQKTPRNSLGSISDIMLSPEAQLKFAEMLSYPVTNKKVQYPPQLAKRFTPWQEAHFPPYEEIAKVRAQWVDRWNREIGG